jgi:hypothetical protein
MEKIYNKLYKKKKNFNKNTILIYAKFNNKNNSKHN